MNPIALGLIVVGIVLLLLGILSLARSKKTQGWALSITGILVIALPFVATYLISR